MKKRIIITVVVLVVLAALGAGGWWAFDTYGDRLLPAEDGLGGSGTVEAEETAISPLVGGPITEVHVEAGSEVTSGTTLFTLDSEILQLQVDQAEAGVKAAQAALDQARADTRPAAEISRAEARVAQATAVRDAAKVQLGYATVIAPRDGVVTRLTASLGENAAPGKTLAVIADLTRLHVTIYVPESRIAELSLDRIATVSAGAEGRPFSGRVVYIASEAEFTPSNIETREQRVKLVYEVRIEIEDADETLRPGMPVDVEF